MARDARIAWAVILVVAALAGCDGGGSASGASDEQVLRAIAEVDDRDADDWVKSFQRLKQENAAQYERELRGYREAIDKSGCKTLDEYVAKARADRVAREGRSESAAAHLAAKAAASKEYAAKLDAEADAPLKEHERLVEEMRSLPSIPNGQSNPEVERKRADLKKQADAAYAKHEKLIGEREAKIRRFEEEFDAKHQPK